MIVVDAHWEIRNLGLKVLEVTMEHDDQIDQLMDMEHLKNYDYSVVKLPTNCIELLRAVEKLGYQFIEVLTEVSVHSLPTLAGPHQRFFNLLSTRKTSADEKALIFENIKAGMFASDRVSLDVNFTKEQSSNRYIGLVNDVLAKKGDLRSIYLKGECIGFILGKTSTDNIYHSLLAGIFEKCRKLGAGSYINHLAYAYAFDNKCRAVNTVFSSNNLSASAIHYSLNCKLLSQQYVLVKHHKEKTR